MAVNCSTGTSICLYCKTTSVAQSEKEFHDIYDEVGLELQLPLLVETYFHVKIDNNSDQRLCDDCVNRLIELYDLAEHAKLENGQKYLDEQKETAEFKEQKEEEFINIVSEQFKESFQEHISTLKNDKQSCHYNTNHEMECNQFYNATEDDESYVTAKKNTEIILDARVSKETITDANDHIIEEDIDYNIETEKTSKSNAILDNDIDDTIEEYYVVEELSNESVVKVESFEITTDLCDQIQEEHGCEEKTFNDDTTNNSHGELYTDEFVLEEHVEDTDEEYEIQERFQSVQEEDSSELAYESKQANENILDVDTDTLTSTLSSDDINCTEEEYLIEEIDCTEEYDRVDLNEYLNRAVNTRFSDLELNWELECKLCSDKYTSFQDLLNHGCIIDSMEQQQSSCIYAGCEGNANDLNSLARHLILQHFPKLEEIYIYSKCPDCQRTFSNIIEFNKHSCCCNIKRKAGSQNLCAACNLNFKSLKRYIFHMQFHLTNHRPRICLICGSLFNNSNQFFDHVQYEHNQQESWACKICDRFFKEKDVYDSHMESHREAKYKYACSYCPKEYTNKSGINLHMEVYHNHKHKPLQCEYCDKEFVNNHSYRNHIKAHTSDVEVESYICSVCGLITKDFDTIKDHVEKDKNSSCFSAIVKNEILSLCYTCENCSLDFYTIQHLRQHRLSSTHNDKVFNCVICRRKFKSLRYMRCHATSHKEYEKRQEAFPITRYYVCNIGQCGEFYLLWSSLYYHKQRRHKTEKKLKTDDDFKCQFCQQLCTSKMSLAVHVARRHNNSNIHCTHCSQTYKSQKQLQDHIDKLHVEVKCDYCFKKFKNRRNLSIHNQSVHINEKRYFCQHCNKGYFYKSEKDAHEKQVHSEISYKCELCNFVTNYPKSLDIHLDKHINQLKFKCTICSKSFGRKQLLNDHLKRHEGKKGYKCRDYYSDADCDAVFITYKLLKTHIQQEHKDSKILEKVASKRKRVDSVKIDDDVIEFLDDNDDGNESTYGKRLTDSSNKRIKHVKSDNNSIEIMVENDLLAANNEYIVQYQDVINNI